MGLPELLPDRFWRSDGETPGAHDERALLNTSNAALVDSDVKGALANLDQEFGGQAATATDKREVGVNLEGELFDHTPTLAATLPGRSIACLADIANLGFLDVVGALEIINIIGALAAPYRAH